MNPEEIRFRHAPPAEAIRGFHWKTNAQEHLFISTLLARRLSEAAGLRQKIEMADPETPEGQLKLWNLEAEEALADLRLIGDALIAAWFSKEKESGKEQARQILFPLLQAWLDPRIGESR